MNPCPQCGAIPQPSDKFCNICGTPVSPPGFGAAAPGGFPPPQQGFGAAPPPPQGAYGAPPGGQPPLRCQMGHDIAPGASYCPHGHPIALDAMPFANDQYGGAPQYGQPGGFGAPPQQQGFGGQYGAPQGGFPDPNAPYGGGYGQPQGGFGAPPPQQGFGGGFGAPPPQQGFQQGGFGGGGFDAQAQPYGQPQGGFGAPPPQAQGGFGAPQPGFGGQPEPAPQPAPPPKPTKASKAAPPEPVEPPPPPIPGAPTRLVTFSSIPLGADVYVDGDRLGQTPLVGVALTDGGHQIKIISDAETLIRNIDVGKKLPSRYVWKGGDRWELH